MLCRALHARQVKFGQSSTSLNNVEKTEQALISIYGPLQTVLIPLALGVDPMEIGPALAAWRHDLTHEEVELLQYVAEGWTNAEIAERLGVAEENTVKNRLKTVFNKLGVRNRARAATVAGFYWSVAASVFREHSKE